MDGGRVLRALFAARLGYVRATEIAATIGQGVAFLLGFLGLFGNPMLIFIAIFVYLAAAVGSASGGDPRDVARHTGDRGDDDAIRNADAGRARRAAVETLLRTSQGEFPVVDGAGRPLGVLARNDLIRALKSAGRTRASPTP